MRSFSAVLIDDESAARSRLRRLLGTTSQLDIIGEAKDGLEAIENIATLAPDLVFLDIQMPGLNGFEVLRALPQEHELPLIVFVTAYDEYALHAFQANAVGYLLKPIQRKDLDRVVTRCLGLLQSRGARSTEIRKIEGIAKAAAPKISRVVVSEGSRFRLISPEEIYFIRAEHGVVKVKTKEGFFRTGSRVADLERSLPQPPFFLARRGVLVNLDRVHTIEPYFRSSYVLVLGDDPPSELQVSERQAVKLRERFKDLG